MPYDPSKPANGSPLNSAEMRGLLQGLKALIDAILTVTAAQVDGVNTVNPGDPANVAVTVIGNTLPFPFDLPRGNDGGPGPQGPPFADAVIDGVTTLSPGDPASVTVSFDGTSVHFQFAIPRGDTGDTGDPGEVTDQQLNDAVADTAKNINAISNFVWEPNDPPTADDLRTVRDKINEVINGLRR